VLQQVEQFSDPNVTANDAFKAVSRYWDRIARPEQLMSACINAMRVLTDPARPARSRWPSRRMCRGIVRLSGRVLRKRVHHVVRRAPAPGEVERAAALITAMQKPLVICGGGIRYSGAERALEAFCAEFNVPFAEPRPARAPCPGTVRGTSAGSGDGHGGGQHVARAADLVIGIGTRLGDFTTASKWLFQNPRYGF